MICVLVLAAGADWESEALTSLDVHPGVVVLRRCMDVDDLLATATSGQADVALVSLEAPGLDPASIEHLRRHQVRPVAVTQESATAPGVRDRAARLDVAVVLDGTTLAEVAQAVTSVEDVADTRVRPAPSGVHGPEDAAALGRSHNKVVAVWGPTGAPGRTTVATNLAAEVARRGSVCLVVDADPYGGSVAQHLGVLDEVSGLLQVSRLAASGALEERWGAAVRAVGTHLGVVTGLPRADRWREVRPAHLEQVVDAATLRSHVVIDTGFAVEEDPGSDLGGRPGRNALTLAALAMADEVVVVGAADPVGLARLARSLVELEQVAPGTATRVVVNRMRPSLGWSERDVAGMVEGFTRAGGLHFLPDDRASADRALLAGSALVDLGDCALGRRLGEVVDAVFPDTVEAAGARRRQWRRPRA
ncbi:MAG: CpaE family protein [Nocardioides sp.]|uniref:AAA family ATPase n=1 Tax=Nocardioides sp. TaxID=35761 RepID=UPI003F018D4A